MTRCPGLPLLALLACLGACGDDAALLVDAAAASDAARPDPFDTIAVDWQPCEFEAGEDPWTGECARVAVPLDWGEPDGPTFQTAVKRRLASVPAEGQLWFLHGGPGGSGTIGLPPMMAAVQAAYPELDVYSLDARGTGDSDYLTCPTQEAPSSPGGEWISTEELDGCIAYLDETWGASLGAYTATNAAIDLAALIHVTREPALRVLIWGGSGGTYWAQRYLQLHPDQADGIVLEGIAGPAATLATQDEFDERMIREIFRRCTEDEVCAAKVPDPLAALGDLVGRLDQGHCAALGVDGAVLRSLLSSFAYYGPFNATLPAVLYRLDRCATADRNAIVHMFQLLFRARPARSLSAVLFMHQVSSEMWLSPELPTPADVVAYLDEVYQDALIASGKGYDRHEVFLRWPKYADPLDDLYATSDVPLLMLQGELDPSTPFAEAVRVGEHFAGDRQHFVSFPHSAHNVRAGSPTVADAGAPAHCGQELFLAFLHDPSAPIDASCVGRTLPLDFEGRVYASALMGTLDYFENETPPPPKAPAVLAGSLAEAVDAVAVELRRRGLRRIGPVPRR